jgi:type IV pilus assembly protein PilA
MKSTKTNGFTLIELIFVIVIIGVLTAVAIPKFQNLTDNAKISSELATAASVQSAIDAAHGDWITNTCNFTWGNEQKSDDLSPGGLNANGYPNSLDAGTKRFDRIFKTKTNDWTIIPCSAPTDLNQTCYKGPASRTDGKGAKERNLLNKPEGNDYWDYNATNGTFTLIDKT